MSTKSKEIHVQFSLTVNLGNWNSAKLGCVLEDEIAPGEVFEDKFDELYGKIRSKIRKELAALTHQVEHVATGENNG